MRAVPAFAKINVSLRVLGTRADGYHELRTVFQSIALRDTITVERAPGPLRIVCSDPTCPGDESNLAWRAAARLWKAAGRRGAPRDARIRITKRIPMEAGLGGGSSDAASTLVALDRAWRIGADREMLRRIAADLGADVPYFIDGGTALGMGRGDLLFPLVDLPSLWVVLVVPPFGVSTKDAYGWWDAGGGQISQVRPRRGPGPAALRGIPVEELVNDLERPVVAHYPEIGRMVSALRRAGADHAAMSGSGSAVFGLFGSRRRAAAAAERAGTATRRVILTRTLGRNEYAMRGEL